MLRRVFFSFHYERDAQRAAVVRNNWVTRPDHEECGYVDAAKWEEVQRQGTEAIKRWIERQMDSTSVTVVLIGKETSDRQWVKYELERSYQRGNGLVGIYLHNIRDFSGNTETGGSNTFGELGRRPDGSSVYFFEIAKTYDWVTDRGYDNFARWVEEAARSVNR
jgi:hypothetical protein